MQIKDVQTKNVATIEKEATVLEAARMMRDHHVGSIVVTEKRDDGYAPVGIITDRDIVVEVIAPDISVKTMLVSDIMSDDIVSVHSNDDVYKTIQVMERNGVRRLPVVDRTGAIVGIVSSDDLLGHLAKEMTSLAKLPRIQKNWETVARG